MTFILGVIVGLLVAILLMVGLVYLKENPTRLVKKIQTLTDRKAKIVEVNEAFDNIDV